MTVKVTREAEPQIELYGAYSGQLDGNGRVSLTFTATDTYLIMVPKNAVSRPQLEAGSFATSYIPTGAAQATRTADVASVSTQAFPYSSTAGTVVAAYTERNQAIGSYVFSLDNGTVNDITDFRTSGYFSVFRSGSLQTQGTVTGLNAAGVSDKIALAATDASFGAVANGGTVVSASSGQMPAAASTLRLGSSPGVNFLNGHIRQVTYIPRRLSNSELQARTV